MGVLSDERQAFLLQPLAPLRTAATGCEQVLALAEDVAFNPPWPFRVPGQKPAALRLVGDRRPEAAWRFVTPWDCPPWRSAAR